MTTLTMRLVKGDFIVTGPDIEPMKFKSRPEARDWCKTHHPGSPITEIGPGGKRAAPRNRQSDRAGDRRRPALSHGVAFHGTGRAAEKRPAAPTERFGFVQRMGPAQKPRRNDQSSCAGPPAAVTKPTTQR